MVLQYQPVQKAISSLRNKGCVVYLSPQGKVLTQSKLNELSNYDDLTLLCGRYEGIDQRVLDSKVDDEISVGDFVLTGGDRFGITIALPICLAVMPTTELIASPCLR